MIGNAPHVSIRQTIAGQDCGELFLNTELRDGINAVLQGETFVTQHFAGKVLTALSAPTDTTVSARLSSREEQIVKLLLQGQTNREMAADLNISERTVKHYMSVLMQKLNARTGSRSRWLYRCTISCLPLFRRRGGPPRAERFVFFEDRTALQPTADRADSATHIIGSERCAAGVYSERFALTSRFSHPLGHCGTCANNSNRKPATTVQAGRERRRSRVTDPAAAPARALKELFRG